MESTDRKIWFRAKRYGWGWGLPVAWQGWVVLFVYALGIAAIVTWLPPEKSPGAFGIGVLALSVVLVAICWMKGEKPKWRWGGDE
ncbi:hypothetical protein [Burkholderia guangdongensis]|uniref:hypothetical protein n=1 Tax=Burkholderia guangdongensis TaxID=1792500 RepID=UPI0015C89B08|nr:hypothetical protein [Burkholderia guangdongensis]